MLPAEIIPEAELKELAGRQQKQAIIDWLEHWNIPYIPSISGFPRVHRLALAHRMGAPIADPGIPSNDSGAPDLSKVR